MNVRIKQRHWLPRLLRVNGITVYPFILLRYSKPIDKDVIKHELIHAEQVENIGWFSFYFSYLFYFLAGLLRYKDKRRAYFQIPYEIEAYKLQELELSEHDKTVLSMSGVKI